MTSQKKKQEIEKNNQKVLVGVLVIIALSMVVLFISSLSDNQYHHIREIEQSKNDSMLENGIDNYADKEDYDLQNDISNNVESEETLLEQPDIPNERLDNDLPQKTDASYERWLAAAMITAVSFQYPGFEIKNIYLTEETDMARKNESMGVYVTFSSDAETRTIYAKPLEKERVETGTIDLYTMDLGFATFDIVNIEDIDTSRMQTVGTEALTELISQSMLVSLYER